MHEVALVLVFAHSLAQVVSRLYIAGGLQFSVVEQQLLGESMLFTVGCAQRLAEQLLHRVHFLKGLPTVSLALLLAHASERERRLKLGRHGFVWMLFLWRLPVSARDGAIVAGVIPASAGNVTVGEPKVSVHG